MSTSSNSQPPQSDESNNDNLDEVLWDLINDPDAVEMDAEIEEEIQEEIESEVDENSDQSGGARRRYIDREREAGNIILIADYFCDNPVYTDVQFCRRFRMRRHVFEHIVQTLSHWSPEFQQRSDAFGKIGFSPLQKCTAALRVLAYGTCADLFDDALRIAEATTNDCVKLFVRGLRENFGAKYFRRPNEEDIRRLKHIGEARGFPGMLESIDCMHWAWNKCPVAWKGQFTRGDKGEPTIMLEAVASHDLWIWHVFFGAAGSNSDINVLNQSPLFINMLQGTAPAVEYTVNGNQYNMGYYLADGIYPEWATFVKSIPVARSNKEKLFMQKQEEARKDVKRAFGVLQHRFAIVRGPARYWSRETLADIMYACVILHNMIVEDERDSYTIRYDYDYEQGPSVPLVCTRGPIHGFSGVVEQERAIRNRPLYRRLKTDLIEHM